MLRNVFAVLLLAQACFAQAASVVHTLETARGAIQYTIDGAFAVTEGDIILGPASEIENYREARRLGIEARKPQSLTLITSTQLWPNATLYYTIDADVPNQQAILDAIAHWNTRTAFKILPRTSEPNYVRFQYVQIDAACNSNIGMIGGAQTIGITNNCPTGSVIHELGHSWGLFHEQQRSDRSGHLTVQYENIDKRYLGNFPQTTAAADTGYYDFDSIMHYPSTGFSVNYQDAIETAPPGIPIAQRDGLSPGDIDGVSRLYKIPVSATTITTTPQGLALTVDGVAGVSPQTFNWAVGTSHTVSTPVLQGTEPRYAFAGWSDEGAATHSITASAATTVYSANFVRQHQFTSGVSATPGTVPGSITVFPAPDNGYLTERERVRIEAFPSPGYQFVRWVGTTFLGSSGVSTSANPAEFEITSSRASYQASFTNGPLTVVDSQPRGAAVLVDGFSYLTPANFAWVPGSSHTLGVTATQLYGNNTRRMQFTSWEDGTKGQRTVIAGQASASYTASFDRQYLLSLSTSGLGTVVSSPTSADGFYDAGSTVQLTAVPGNGQTFRYWLGDAAGGSPTVSIRMDRDRLATAYFGSPVTSRVLNSGSLLSTANVGSSATLVAPGEIVAIFGSGFGPDPGQFAVLDANGRYPFTLAGTTVTFDGVAAPLLYVSSTQVNTVVPYSVSGKTSSVLRITSGSGAASSVVASTISVAASSPALFTYDGSGVGQLAALNQDGTVNSPTNPAPPGSVVVLYGTGGGVFDKAFPDGQVLGVDLGHAKSPVWVRFGKLPGDVLYAGTSPYLVNGTMQINVRLPAELIGGGAVPVQWLVGTAGSQTGVTISVAAAQP